MMDKQKGRAYIDEGKMWDDTDSDEEPIQSNYAYALMADTAIELKAYQIFAYLWKEILDSRKMEKKKLLSALTIVL